MSGLPKLTVLQDVNSRKVVSCASRPDRCRNCPASKHNGGACSGCNADKLKSCVQSSCFYECNTCAGYKVLTPAICVKAPLRDTYMGIVTQGQSDWAKSEYRFTPRKRIDHNQKAVIMARGGGVKTTTGSPYIPEIDVVAASLIDVWGPRGWYSNDLKDYLRLLPHQKLFIVTAMRDHRLELAWDKEMFGGPEYKEVGIDYWAPLIFSTYKDNSHLQNYFQYLRTMYSIQRGKSHFTVLPAIPGLDLKQYADSSSKVIRQAIFNAQFLSGNDTRMAYMISWVRKYDLVMPQDFPFWFVGTATPKFVHNVRKYAPNRELYFVSAAPFRLANHGKRLLEDGSIVKAPEMSKEEILFENQKTLVHTVERYSTNTRGRDVQVEEATA